MINGYKLLITNQRIHQERLMFEFDFITRYAEENELNDYPMDTVHKLLTCGERDHCRIFRFHVKMLNDDTVSPETFVPWKRLLFVDNIAVVPNQYSYSTAFGYIVMKRLTSRQKLYESMKQLLSNPFANFGFYISPNF